MDGILRRDGEVLVNGKRNVPELWNDSNDRNLDLNWFDNDWNSNYRFLAVSMFHKLKPPSHGGGLS